MRKTSLILLLIVIGCTQQRVDKNFKRVVQEYVNEYMNNYPIQASLLGKHEFDSRLDNWDKVFINNRIKQLYSFQARLKQIDSTLLSEPLLIDYMILQKQINNEIWELKQYRPWQKDGRFYVNLLKKAVVGITAPQYFSVPKKCQNLGSRLLQFPRLINQAKQNLSDVTKISVQQAITDIDKLEYLLSSEVTKIAHQCTDSLFLYNKIVIDSLTSYKSYLKESVLPFCTRKNSTGKELYRQILLHKYCIEVSPEELLARADEEYQWCFQQILTTTDDLYRKYFSRSQNENNKKLEKVLDKIAANFTQDELLVELSSEIVENIKRFLNTKNLIDFPENLTLKIKRTPEWENNYQLAFLYTPGPFDKAQNYIYYLKSLPDNLSWFDQVAFAKQFNKTKLEVLTIQNILPGKLLLFTEFNDISSQVRKIFPDKSFIAGWAYYAGFMMIDAGYGGYDLKIKLLHLISYLQAITSAIADIKYHTRTLSSEDMHSILINKGMLDTEDAENVITEIMLNPAHFVPPFWGYLQLKNLAYESRAILGNYFSCSMFLKHLLREGAIPLPILYDKLERDFKKQLKR